VIRQRLARRPDRARRRALLLAGAPDRRLAVQQRLPTLFSTREPVQAGGLMSYGPNLAEQFYRAATYVDKILAAPRPAELPVEQPTTFELVINLNTARSDRTESPPGTVAARRCCAGVSSGDRPAVARLAPIGAAHVVKQHEAQPLAPEDAVLAERLQQLAQ
jgi:hypothetical protein